MSLTYSKLPRNTKVERGTSGKEEAADELSGSFQETCEVLQNYRSEAIRRIFVQIQM
jgi:hypothetical protein